MDFMLFLLTLGILFNPVRAHVAFERGIRTCTNIKPSHVPGAEIISIESEEKHNFTDIPNLSVCEVNVTLTHTNAVDKVLVQIWLPLNNWNGRFMAMGGSGWAAGLGDLSLAPVVAQGFAAATTNAGLSGDPINPGLWALKDNGKVNWNLLTNFGSRSVHDLAIAGKATTANYYGVAAKYSYWNGCSTGGRQGLVAAQKYPNDFDGILAGSPAINWAEYVVAEHWPQVVMNEAGAFPSPCELDGVVQAAVAACDELDGVKDNVVTNLAQCKFDPFKAVGSKVQFASIVSKIWDGPTTITGAPLWYGLPVGALMDYLANSKFVNGSRVGDPFFANPNFDSSSVNSAELYAEAIDSACPDLSGLRKSGGKLLGTTTYRQNVERALGGAAKGLTPGAIPSDPFGALVSWVERGIAPDMLVAETSPNAPAHFTRKVCRYPLVSKYRGYGDPTSLASYNCVDGY
ncbi:tannase and feruloyl esterase-domain-containing protein [Hyaloscypha sp. PMI_1271]|nr:tannase and feruloyl esterase-domain-containing protein [Hyaloscypha sp. PMI_1271]